MMVIIKWSLCLYLNPQEFLTLFSPLHPVGQGEDYSNRMGVWQQDKAKSSTQYNKELVK